MLDEDRCRRAIGEAFPGLEVRSARYFAAGWDYELWEINDELLFRFPMREECAEPLRVESRLLAELAEHLSMPVPRPAYVSDGVASFQQPFFAYRKLAGVPLEEAGASEDERREIAAQVGRFLHELHSFPVERAAALGVPVFSPEGWRQHYVEFYEKVRPLVVPLLSANEAAALESFWRKLLDSKEFFQFSPALIHRDLGGAHVLVDGERIAGVIDFGDVCVADPGFDFTGWEGDFRERALAAYGLSQDQRERFSARADTYRKIIPFHAVIYGVGGNHPESTQRGVEAIRERLAYANG